MATKYEFTDRQIAGWKPTKNRQELRDAKAPLYVVVYPSGEKSFQVRKKVAGKDRRFTLGSYPNLKLADARKFAWNFDPPEDAKETSLVPPDAGLTVSEAFRLYMAAEGNQKRSAGEKWRVYSREVEPTLGTKPLAAVTRHDLAKLVTAKHATAPIMSNHLHSLLTRFLNWSMVEGWSHTSLEANPMLYVKKLATPKVRERTLSDDEIRLLFKALPEVGVFGPVFELILRTLVRRGEAFGMMGEDVTGELWTVPGPRTKNGKPHVVWLHSSVRALIGDTKPGKPVFGLSVEACSNPMARLRAKMGELADDRRLPKLERFTLHDLRRTGATWMAGCIDENYREVVSEKTVERILNHSEQRVIKHYNHHAYLNEKRAAWNLWNDHLDRLRSIFVD